MGIQLSDCAENIVGKGEIARYEQFLLFPQCFQKLFVADVSKQVCMEFRVIDPIAPKKKGVCLPNISKFHSDHLQIWHLL